MNGVAKRSHLILKTPIKIHLPQAIVALPGKLTRRLFQDYLLIGTLVSKTLMMSAVRTLSASAS